MKRLIKLKPIIAEKIPTDMEIPAVMYHATFKAYLPSIKEKGLVPNGSNANYDGMVENNAVYLADDYDTAESYAECAETDDEIYDSGIVVIKVDTTKLDRNNFGIDQNVVIDENETPATIAYYGTIPVSAMSF